MKREEILSQLKEIIQSILQYDIALNEELTTIEIEGWDSLAHINIINAVEKKFNIKFKLTDFYKIKNIGIFVDLIVELVNQ